MTAEQIRRLRKSFHLMARRADIAAYYFYRQLFEMDPALRPIFKRDIELQAATLTGMLRETLELLEQPLEWSETLRDLGARQAEYGVKPAQYATVATALISMLESVLGEDFTAETRQAWVALYRSAAETMREGAEHALC